MPIKIPNDLPAFQTLENENIFVIPDDRAAHQDIRALKIAIVNLMPDKIATETQLLRLLSNTPLHVDIDLIQMSSHMSKNTSLEHMLAFYKNFDEVCDNRYDGLIITGAPVEQMEYEDVDVFHCPHSRHTEVRRADIEKVDDLIVVAVSNEAGVHLVSDKTQRQFFLFGHWEYDRETLAKEYFRDKEKGLPIQIPYSYFPDDDPENKPIFNWSCSANLLYSNWLNYCIYQKTPYDLNELEPLGTAQ